MFASDVPQVPGTGGDTLLWHRAMTFPISVPGAQRELVLPADSRSVATAKCHPGCLAPVVTMLGARLVVARPAGARVGHVAVDERELGDEPVVQHHEVGVCAAAHGGGKPEEHSWGDGRG